MSVFASHSVEWATKVDAIPGEESPIAIDDDGFQFTVLPPALANPGDVRRFCMTSLLTEFRQFLAQAFINEQFHDTSFRRGLRRVETITAPAGNEGDRRGLPRCGLASE